MAEIDLFTRFETQAMWRLPDSDRRYAGVFTFDPEHEITLKTTIYFDHTDWLLFRELHELPIIHLTDEKGQRWTLFDSVVVSLGTGSVQFFINYAIEGFHFASIEALLFRSYQIRLPYLDTWLKHNPFRHSVLDEGSEQWHYIRPENIEINLPDKDLCLVLGGARNSIANSDPPSVSVTYHTGIVVKRSDEGIAPLDWLQEQTFYFIEFLSLLLGRPLWRISIRLVTEDSELCNLIFRQTIERGPDQIHTLDVLVPFQDIKENFTNIIEKWFQVANACAPAIELLAGFRSDRSGFLQNKLLMLTTAFEVFHRRTQNGIYMLAKDYQSQYETMVQNIPGNIGKDHRNALKKRLEYGNEYSLRKRFSVFFKELPEPILEFFPDRDKFVDQVVDWRNQLTHYSEYEATLNLRKTEELYLLCRRLEMLIIIALLRQVGVDYETLTLGLANCQHYRDLAAAKTPPQNLAHSKNLNIKGIFWDYPDLQNEDNLRKRLATGNDAERNWILARMLDYGRVVDTMRLFDISEIRNRLYYLPLRKETKDKIIQKWTRLIEVYAAKGK